MPVNLIITTTNRIDKSATLTKAVVVDNSLTDNFRYSLYLSKTEYTDLQSVALLGAQMKLTLRVPTNPINEQDLGQTKTDCFEQGTCSKGRNGNIGIGNEGFSGIDCSIESHEFNIFNSSVQTSLQYLIKLLAGNGFDGRSNTEMRLNVLSNILLRPELIKYEHISGLSQILSIVSKLDDSIVLSVSDDFMSIFLVIASRFFLRVRLEMNVDIKNQIEDEYSKSLTASSLSEEIGNVQSYSKTVWVAVEKYLSQISSKLISTNSLLEYETFTGFFKLEYKEVSSINGKTYWLNSDKHYSVSLPANLFDGTSITSIQCPIILMSMSWYTSPILLSEVENYTFGSDVVSLNLLNGQRRIIEVKNKQIVLSILGYSKLSRSLISPAGASGDVNLCYSSFTENNGTVVVITSSSSIFSRGNGCHKQSVAYIISSHLSSYVVQVTANSSTTRETINGVGTIYYDFSTMSWEYILTSHKARRSSPIDRLIGGSSSLLE